MRALALATLLLIGCPTGDPGEGPGTFVLHIPAAGAEGVPPSTDITAEWTAPVEGVAITVLHDGAALSGQLNQVQEGDVWAWVPDDEFAEEALHSVVIDWVTAEEPVSFSFTTGAVLPTPED